VVAGSKLRGIALRARDLSRLFILILVSLLFASAAFADPTFEESAKLLPNRLGDFQASGRARPYEISKDYAAMPAGKLVGVERTYRSADGQKAILRLVRASSDSAAYALLTNASPAISKSGQLAIERNGIGTASLALPNHVFFFQGPIFVSIKNESPAKGDDALLSLARALAETLDKGEGEVPVLVKHLPDWESVFSTATYAATRQELGIIAGNRPVLDAVSFDGGAEAVAANYGSSRLVIIEHTTPQIATENDARINARLSELRAGGLALPSGYRRVGNYSVFVFDAPDEATATQLVDKIAYEQVVQWLGTNPYLYERARREYSETTAGVILSVIKASGLSLLACLGIGGIFGAIVFRRRRAQQAMTEAYTDAGGMLRLNLDEISSPTPSTRLLGKGDV
jgi:hypothetical protein